MAYTQSSLVNVLFKKFITGKAQTSDALAYYSEPYNSRSNVFYNDIWLQSDQIPTTAATVSGVTTFVSVTMSYYVNSSNSGGYYDSTGVLRDIIPFNYGDGSSYAYQIFRNDGTTSIPLGQCDWLLDPNSGVLTFYTGAVGGTVNNGVSNIATPAAPPVVKAWKYVGLKSVIPNLYGLTYSGGTMSISPSLFGTGLTYSGGVLSTTITAVAGNGLTSSGNTFSVLLQSNSGLTVSSSGLALNPSLIGTGLTYSGGVLSTTITAVAGNGLTSSGNTFSVLLTPSNSGLTVSNVGLAIKYGSGLAIDGSGNLISSGTSFNIGNGLATIGSGTGTTISVALDYGSFLTFSGASISVSSKIAGTGLSYSNGVLNSLYSSGFGLTLSNSYVYSVLLQSNSGLTVSSSGLGLNPTSIGSGLTFSSGVLSNTAISTAGVGLTFSGNTHSVLLQTNSGLTVSSSGLGILFGSGLTFSGGLSIATSSVYVQGGNSFGATATLGTNDNYNIQVVAGGNKIIQFGTSSITLQSPINNNIYSLLSFSSSSIYLTKTSPYYISATYSGGYSFVYLPDTSTLQLGQSFYIFNTNNITTIYTFTGAQLLFISGGNPSAIFTCVNTGTNSTDAWQVNYNPSNNGDVTVATNTNKITSNNFYSMYSNTSGMSFYSGNTISVKNIFKFNFNAGTGILNPTSSTYYFIQTNGSFGPTSGSSSYNELTLSTSFGSTSSALGSSAPVRGIYITPSFSNSYVWDYRSIETTQGKVVFNDSISATGSSIGSLLTLNQTWNTTGTASIFVVNATEFVSGINSKLLDLQKNSVSQYSVDKNGNVNMSGNLVVGVTASPRTVTVSGTLSTANFVLTGAPSTTAATYSYLVRNNATNNVELSGVYSGPPLQMYASTYTFTPSVPNTFTHSLSSSDFIIQMYDISTGDEVMAQYSNRTTNTIDITVFDNITARIVIIG
jgi:hypothetical protein